MRKPTRGAEQRAIGHGVAVRQRFSALPVCADFETAKHDHHWRRPEPGVGPSRSRHRPPSDWIIERFAGPARWAQRWRRPLKRDPDSNIRGRSGQLLAAHSVGGTQAEPIRTESGVTAQGP